MAPDHISERYGLFTIIVLGESVLGPTAASLAVAVPVVAYLLIAGVLFDWLDRARHDWVAMR